MRGISVLILLGACAVAACDGGGGDPLGPYLCDDGVCACEGQSVCDGECGDGCDLECRDASECEVACDDGCRMLCESVSTCAVDCGVDCDVTCRDLSTCTVTMVSGIASCENVSDCDIGCWIGGDVIEPAVDEGGGVFSCP